MNILLVCNYKGSWPYIPNLSKRLASLSYNVDILDIGEFRFFTVNNSNVLANYQIVPNFLLKLPFIRKYFRNKITRKFLRKLNKKYDVVNLHYATKIYSYFLNEFRAISNKVILNMWGSDYYRDRFNRETEIRQMQIYDSVDEILFANEIFQKSFCAYYLSNYNRSYLNKSAVVRWGIDNIEVMEKIKLTEDRRIICQHFGIDPNCIIITIGYNASIYQQHIKIIRSILEIRSNFLDKIVLMLPMTYREDEEGYIERVRSFLDINSFNYLLISSFMTDIDVARLRLITDIAINMQTTDDLNASIQEHLYSGKIVLAGDWLPYEVFSEYGIYLERVSFENLSTTILKIYDDYDNYLNKFKNNVDKIYKFSSWEFNLPFWVDHFCLVS